jgi:hypothetical protein
MAAHLTFASMLAPDFLTLAKILKRPARDKR